MPLDFLKAAEPVKGGKLSSIANPEPPNLNPGLNQLASTQLVAGKIFQSLLDYDFDFKPRPRLAESWTISEDGLTYTFKLRTDVKWHDGKPFTSKDVIFSAKEMLPKSHPRARVAFARCQSIEAPDDHTVVFTLNAAFPPFILVFDNTTSPIIPAHVYEGTDFSTNPANAAPIGTGPFKFKEWARGQYIHLVRNDDYYKPGLPYLDEIFFSIIPDGATRALALETGQIDMTSSNDLEYIDIKRLSALPDIVTEQKGWEFFAPHAFIEMNERVKPYDDKRFRQAVMYALDRDFIRDNIWYGFGEIPTGPIDKRTKFYDGNVRKYSHDPAKAAALLDEMGLKPDGDGVRLRTKLLQIPFGETWTRTAEYIKQALAKVGIHVEMETADSGGWMQRTSNWDFEMTLNFPYQYADPALGVARTYISTNITKGIMFSNTVGYSNPKVDELFEKAGVALDPKDRQALYSQVQKILVEDVPVAWFLEIAFPTLYRNRFHNIITSAIGVADDFDDVWVDA